MQKAYFKDPLLAAGATPRFILVVTDGHVSPSWLRQFASILDASRHAYLWHDVSTMTQPDWRGDSLSLVLVALGDPTESVPAMHALLGSTNATGVTRLCLSRQSQTMPSLLPPVVDDRVLDPLDRQSCHKQLDLWMQLDAERRLRRDAEAKLAAATTDRMTYIDQVFKEARAGFMLVSASGGRITYQNPQVAVIFGQYLETSGRDWHGDDCLFRNESDGTTVYLSAYIAKACAGESFFNTVDFYRRADGSEVDIRLHASPVRDATGAITEIAVTFRKYTQERRHAAQQAQLAKQLQVLADTSGSHVIMLDPDEHYLFANAMHKAWAGVSSSRLSGKRLVDVVGPEVYWQLRSGMKGAFEGESSASEIELATGAGQTGHFSVRWEPLRYLNYTDGRCEGAILYFRDMGALRAAQSDASLSAQRFRAIFDELQLIVYTIDSINGVHYFNRAWTDYTGLALKDSLGLQWLSAVHPDDVAMLKERVTLSGHQQGAIEYETRIRNRRGEYEWHLARSLPLAPADGDRPGQRVGVVVNIHDRKMKREQVEQRLRANVLAGARAQQRWAEEKVKVDALQREREAREDFVAALSHDLRTPLTVVRLGVQRLEHKLAGDARLLPIVVRMLRSVVRIDNMIRDFLDVTRVSAGRSLTLERVPCCLVDVMRSAFEELTPLHGGRLQLGPTEPALGMWDSDSLHRVIDNLVGNAIKYGDDTQAITLGLHLEGNTAVMTVHNFGDVIPAEQQSKLFERFTRLDGALEGSTEGWGIGLQLVAAIAAAYDGSVHIVSEEVEGTTFSVALPILPPAEVVAQAFDATRDVLRKEPNLPA